MLFIPSLPLPPSYPATFFQSRASRRRWWWWSARCEPRARRQLAFSSFPLLATLCRDSGALSVPDLPGSRFPSAGAVGVDNSSRALCVAESHCRWHSLVVVIFRKFLPCSCNRGSFSFLLLIEPRLRLVGPHPVRPFGPPWLRPPGRRFSRVFQICALLSRLSSALCSVRSLLRAPRSLRLYPIRLPCAASVSTRPNRRAIPCASNQRKERGASLNCPYS